MTSRTARWAAFAGAATLTATLVQVPAQAVTVVPAVTSPSPKAAACQYALSKIDAYRTSSAFLPPDQLVILEDPANPAAARRTVDIATMDIYRTLYPDDPSRTLWFQAMTWLALAAVDASEKGDTTAANQYATAMIGAANRAPDPGSATPAALAYSRALGWDAGTVIRRSQALMCLAAHTGVQPVRALLAAHGTALVDPNRYGGPPQRRVANAGIMANLTLIDIGRLLGRQDFVRIAVGRLVNDHPQVFSELGWSYEGSTHYQTRNIQLWEEAAQTLRRKGYIAAANSIATRLALALKASAQVIGPTGLPVLIGNTRADDVVLKPSTVGLPLTWIDQPGGLAVGRWSFTDPKTTYWTMQNRPTRGAHGHADNTALTWQTLRVPVFLDGGQFNYDRVNAPLTVWSLKPVAQNRSVPNRQFRETTRVQDMTVTRDGRVDDILVHTSDLGPLQTRRAVIDDQRGVMQVYDATEVRQTQYFQFAPGWKLVDSNATDALLRHSTGARVRVNSPDGRISSLTGSLSPIGGWFAVGIESVVPVTQLLISGAPQMTTTFDFMTKKESDIAAPVIDRKSRVAGKRRAGFAWDPGSATKVQGYRIQVNAGGNGWADLVLDTGSTKTATTVRKLVNGTAYRFRVATLTKRGISPYSAPSRPIVPEVPTVKSDTEPVS